MLGKRCQKRRRGFTILIGPYVKSPVGLVDGAVIHLSSRRHCLCRNTKGWAKRRKA